MYYQYTYTFIFISVNFACYLLVIFFFFTSNCFKLIMSTPLSCPRASNSLSKASMRTIVFTVFPCPLTESRIIRAFSGTSQITVEMAAEGHKSFELVICGGLHLLWLVLKLRLWCTSVQDVTNGLCAQGVVQWNHHQGVCVACQFWNGPLKGKSSKYETFEFCCKNRTI